MPPSEITFAAVPYAALVGSQAVALGGFTLWPNTPGEWVARTGVDGTGFMEMYRTGPQAVPVTHHGSVLTRNDLGPAALEEFRRIVVSLSTAAWLEDRAKAAADPWVFDVWPRVPTAKLAADMHFLRESKFSVNVTNAEFDRFYPTPFTHTLNVGGSHWCPILGFLHNELSKDRSDSIVTALSYFHLARFQTPYFTSPADDIESLWSGFEAMYDLKRKPAAARLQGLTSRLPRRLRRAIDELLRPETDERDKTPKAFIARLREELEPQLPLPEDFWKGAL